MWKTAALGTGVIAGLAAMALMGFRISLYRHNTEELQKLGQNQQAFTELIQTIHRETPYLVYVTSGYRSTEHQKRLYKANPKNARPGTSPHEHKRAIDINLIGLRGYVRKADSKDTWKKTGVPQIAERLGFRWGGNFKYYHDPVHFDVRNPG